MISSSVSSRMARRPRAPVPRLSAFCRDRAQRGLLEGDLHVLEVEQLHVLLGERVLRLLEDLDQRVFVERLERYHDRQAADQLGNQPVAQQIIGLHFAERVFLAPRA